MLRDDSTSRRHFSTFSVNFFTWRHKYSQTETHHSRAVSGDVTSTARQSLNTAGRWVVPSQVQPDSASSQQGAEWCRYKYSQTEPRHTSALSGAVTSTARQRLNTAGQWVVFNAWLWSVCQIHSNSLNIFHTNNVFVHMSKSGFWNPIPRMKLRSTRNIHCLCLPIWVSE